MTAEIKDALLLAHNEKRNLIASGNVTGLGPAVRMATMVWDDELSTLAELNTKQCTMVHDSCHNTSNAYRKLINKSANYLFN